MTCLFKLPRHVWLFLANALARRALAEERARLDAAARMLWGTKPGTRASLVDGISEACRHSVPAAVTWTIEERTAEDLCAGRVRIVVERPSFGPRRVA